MKQNFPHHQPKSSFYATFLFCLQPPSQNLSFSFVIILVFYGRKTLRRLEKSYSWGEIGKCTFSFNMCRKNRKTFHKNFPQRERAKKAIKWTQNQHSAKKTPTGSIWRHTASLQRKSQSFPHGKLENIKLFSSWETEKLCERIFSRKIKKKKVFTFLTSKEF